VEVMIKTKSALEILKESEIKNQLKDCFRNCAEGRQKLRECVIRLMDKGVTKENILTTIHKVGATVDYNEASLCSIVAIGQALRYEEKHPETKSNTFTDKENKQNITDLQRCLNKCGLARKKLRKCIVNALNLGLSQEEILGLTDEIVGGLGKDDVSLCGIIAVDQVLRYEESMRTKPIDIIKERELEREGAD
jgi:hypothetical protein